MAGAGLKIYMAITALRLSERTNIDGAVAATDDASTGVSRHWGPPAWGLPWVTVRLRQQAITLRG